MCAPGTWLGEQSSSAPAGKGRQVADLPAVAPDSRADAGSCPIPRQRCPARHAPVFRASNGAMLSLARRIYKTCDASLEPGRPRAGAGYQPAGFRATPLRSTSLGAPAVEINVHPRLVTATADLSTPTNRYAEINRKPKIAPRHSGHRAAGVFRGSSARRWRSDQAVFDGYPRLTR